LIEAFEIGVSIALQDGVSDSIGVAQRNLAALERAVNASGVAIKSLLDAGSRAASIPVMSSRDQPVSPAVAQGKKNVHSIEQAEHGFASQARGAPDAGKKDFAESIPVFPPAGTTGDSVDNRQATLAPIATIELSAPSSTSYGGMAAFRGPETSSKSISQSHITEHSPPALRTLSSPESREAAPVAVVPISPQRSPYAAPSATPPHQVQSSDADSRRGSSSPHGIELFQFSHSIEHSWLIDRAKDNETIPVTSEELPSQSEIRTWTDSTAKAPLTANYVKITGDRGGAPPVVRRVPSNQAAQTPWPDHLAETMQAPDSPRIEKQQRSVAPQTQRQEPTATTGDVYLDGQLVGRWVSRFLQKQAERADAGPTGFDAKRGRLLPGVTVGG
jgi:hypothetical protein